MPESMEMPQEERNLEPENAAGLPSSADQERQSPGFEGSSWGARPPADPPPAAAPPIVNYCRVCGCGLTAAQAIAVQGVVYCPDHAPRSPAAYGQPPYPPPPSGTFGGHGSSEPASPYRAAAVDSASPGLAFLLGLIPGVGAVYNAQYVKAIVHVVVLGLLISIVSSDAASGFEPLFGLLIAIWYLYMPFEAYHTARKRAAGLPVDDISSLFPMRSRSSGFPVGPVALIALGVVFLLAQFDLISLRILLRFWPVALIAAGGWMLYERMSAEGERP